MTLIRPLLILSAFVICHAQALMLSKEATSVLVRIGVDMNSLPHACELAVMTKVAMATTDAAVDQLCTTMNSTASTSLSTSCKKPGYIKTIVTSVCDEVNESIRKRDVRLNKIAKVVSGTSAVCKKAAGTLSTWLDIEMICDNTNIKQKSTLMQACPKIVYGPVWDAACSSSSEILAGVATLAICLLTQVINKM